MIKMTLNEEKVLKTFPNLKSFLAATTKEECEQAYTQLLAYYATDYKVDSLASYNGTYQLTTQTLEQYQHKATPETYSSRSTLSLLSLCVALGKIEQIAVIIAALEIDAKIDDESKAYNIARACVTAINFDKPAILKKLLSQPLSDVNQIPSDGMLALLDTMIDAENNKASDIVLVHLKKAHFDFKNINIISLLNRAGLTNLDLLKKLLNFPAVFSYMAKFTPDDNNKLVPEVMPCFKEVLNEKLVLLHKANNATLDTRKDCFNETPEVYYAMACYLLKHGTEDDIQTFTILLNIPAVGQYARQQIIDKNGTLELSTIHAKSIFKSNKTINNLIQNIKTGLLTTSTTTDAAKGEGEMTAEINQAIAQLNASGKSDDLTLAMKLQKRLDGYNSARAMAQKILARRQKSPTRERSTFFYDDAATSAVSSSTAANGTHVDTKSDGLVTHLDAPLGSFSGTNP